MINFLRLFFLLFCLTSCSTLQPYLIDTKDPFTAVRKRSMFVGVNNTLLTWESIVRQYSGKPSSVIPATFNYWLSLDIEGRDTTLTAVRIFPEKGYDIPSDSRIRIKFFDKQDNGPIVDLPLTSNYHTTAGPLIAKAHVNAATIRLLQREDIDHIRIERVSTNEAQFEHVDLRALPNYAKAFRKGSVLLFEPPRERSAPRRRRK